MTLIFRYLDDTNFAGTENSNWAVKWNVFDSGLANSQIKQAQNGVTEAKEQARHVSDNIALEVSQAYQSMKEAEKRIETDAVAVDHEEVDFKLSKERYAAGIGTNLDVMDAELALTQAKTNALDRDDRPSIRYCADHSLLLSVFWLVALVGGLMAFGTVIQFLQGGCR